MSSDSDYDDFNYNSSQDSSYIDDQIDLFEFRQCMKSRKTKQKIKKPLCPISRKTFKSQPTLVRINCMSYKKTPKAERKSFRYDRYPQKPKPFECDEKFQETSTCTHPNLLSKFSAILKAEYLQSFSNFRRYFYYLNHQVLKTSFKDHPNIQITDIRLAPVNKSRQNYFMRRLNKSSYFPVLVYHGTTLDGIESILHYGFLKPGQAHPSNSKAPIIHSAHDNSFGSGIYWTQITACSLSYVNTTNTLLVCAAIPKHLTRIKLRGSRIFSFVLPPISKIMPVFLLDFEYLNQSNINRPWFNKQPEKQASETKTADKSAVISRKYLRKVLNFMDDEVRKNQYQVRSFSDLV
jgi:hypothetical protein